MSNDHYSGVVSETQSYVAYLWDESSWDVPLFHAQHVMNLIQRVLFAALSVFANFGILYFHWTTPPHPKFTVLQKSRVSIRLHLLSGTVNVLLPIVAFCDSNKTSVVAICWVTFFVDLVHLATVIHQTPNVNGQRNLTVPAYQFISCVKLVSASGLLYALLDDSLKMLEKVEWLWCVWANHQTYAWVRVWLVLLHQVQACRESRYTVAVIIAGTIGAGQAYGFTVMTALIVWLLAFNWVLKRNTYALVARFSSKKQPTVEERAKLNLEMSAMLQYFHEAHHSLFHDSRYKGQASLVQKTLFNEGFISLTKDKRGRGGTETLVFAPLRDIPDEIQARCVFESIDFDNSGGLDLLELAQVFITNGVSTECTTAMCKLAFENFDSNEDGVIDLNEFKLAFKPYYAYQFAEVYTLLKEAPRMLKNVINAPFQSAPSGCPFASQHMLPMDYDSAVLEWATLVHSENHKYLGRALARVNSQLQRASSKHDASANKV